MLQGRNVAGTITNGNFSKLMEKLKFSGLYRKLCKDSVDTFMPGPPSFFTRRRDGISFSAFDRFMTGYRNLFKMDILNKTLENSYLVMNRQVLTNDKSLLSEQGQAEGLIDNNCKLC
jgi:hypothetical protein